MPTTIEAFLAELDAALVGGRRHKADVLAEVRDGLVDAADAHRRGGSDPAEAQRRAVTEFGSVGELAPQFQGELGLAQGRRTAVLLFMVLLAQPLGWRMPDPPGADALYAVLREAIRLAGGASMLGAVAAALACGIGVRYLGVRRRVTRAVGVFAATASAALAGCGALLTVLGPGLGPAPVARLVLVLVLPLVVVAVAARRCVAAA